jgi:hypothetical protein
LPLPAGKLARVGVEHPVGQPDQIEHSSTALLELVVRDDPVDPQELPQRLANGHPRIE